jgi:chloramphenicol 3-O-phosphotransferase
VVILSGVPGAGKSTIAPLLAARLDRGVHIEADSLQRMIVSGGRWPGQEPHDEAKRQLRLRGRNACLLADSFFDSGFSPILDDVVLGSRLNEHILQLKSRPVFLVTLVAELGELERRNLGRRKAGAFHQSQGLAPLAQANPGLVLDTTRLTPEATVDQIVSRLEPEARIAERVA